MILVLACLLAQPLAQHEEARWIRYAAISPDGQQVAFSYAGDLWVAPTMGGMRETPAAPQRAELLTTHVGYERSPVWAPDSRTIAFAADWFGQLDVFVTSLERAPAKRLTFHSSNDTPTGFSNDGSEVWFTSARQDAVEARIGTSFLSELYAVPAEGGAPRRLLTTPAEHARASANGDLVLYQDLKGFENQWRKHHESSVARDLWTWNPTTGEHVQRTTYRGEDRDGVWLPEGETIAFLSARGGTLNVWTGDINALGDAQPVTEHEVHPVRFLSAARDGTLAYTHNGELWIKAPGEASRRLAIAAQVDQRANPITRETLRDGATEMAVSPDEDEVAFVTRGEIFVASLAHGTTRRVTLTPEQERSVSWAKDGRTLYYASERDGSWNLYSTTLAREAEEDFSASTLLREDALLADERETFQPLVSPDGKHLAFLADREAIHMMDLETLEEREVVSDEWNYSYTDGDISYAWSPDSSWLSFTYSPYRRFSSEAGAVDVASGEIVNVSSSGYGEGSPRFTPDGKAIVYTTGRYGQQEHSGSGGQSDVVGVYLTGAAYDWALLDWEEIERLDERKKKAEKGKADEDGEEDDGDSADEGEDEIEEPVEPIEFDRKDLDQRRRRLTLQSAPIGDVVVTPDGEAVIYLAEVDGEWDVWTSHFRDRKTQRLFTLGDENGNGELHLTADGKQLVVRTSKGALKLAKLELEPEHKLPKGGKLEPIAFAAEMTIDGPAERAHMFEHAWRQMREKFYRQDLHGADWDGLRTNYASRLPHVHNGYDFAELLSEMLGELNASHTGARYRPRGVDRDDTASLGLIYGELDASGLEIDEVLAGGPADRADSRLAAGDRITAIDGQALDPGQSPWPLLDRKSAKPVLLSVRAADGADFEEVVKPIGSRAERELLYKRWIKRCETLVDELSEGRVGYVHVRGMNDGSYREVFDQVLGRCSDRQALLIDTRWNGGGWLHDQLVTFLGGESYCQFVPRDKEPGRYGGEPSMRWSRPVCVVQNEGNYSDAHFFPYSFQTLGLGKLVGTPVAGTSTAVWWESLIDGATVFGIPQLGVTDMQGRYLENQELFPDIEVYNDPASIAAGRDLQLEAAVRQLLDEAAASESGVRPRVTPAGAHR